MVEIWIGEDEVNECGSLGAAGVSQMKEPNLVPHWSRRPSKDVSQKMLLRVQFGVQFGVQLPLP